MYIHMHNEKNEFIMLTNTRKTEHRKNVGQLTYMFAMNFEIDVFHCWFYFETTSNIRRTVTYIEYVVGLFHYAAWNNDNDPYLEGKLIFFQQNSGEMTTSRSKPKTKKCATICKNPFVFR